MDLTNVRFSNIQFVSPRYHVLKRKLFGKQEGKHIAQYVPYEGATPYQLNAMNQVSDVRSSQAPLLPSLSGARERATDNIDVRH